MSRKTKARLGALGALAALTTSYYGATRYERELDVPEVAPERAKSVPNLAITKNSPEENINAYRLRAVDLHKPLLEGRLDIREVFYGRNPWQQHKTWDAIAIGSFFEHPSLEATFELASEIPSGEQVEDLFVKGFKGMEISYAPGFQERLRNNSSLKRKLNTVLATPENTERTMSVDEFRQVTQNNYDAVLSWNHVKNAPEGWTLYSFGIDHFPRAVKEKQDYIIKHADE